MLVASARGLRDSVPEIERPFAVDPIEYPFADQWMPLGDGRVHYIDQGRGIPVVMVHGNATWSFLYRNVIKLLPGIRSIAIDLPGFGFSTAPHNYRFTPQEHADALAALVRHLDLRRYVLVVHDWGGPVGFGAAVREPDRVAGIVNLGTWCWKSDPFTKLFGIARATDDATEYADQLATPEARRVLARSLRRESDWVGSIGRELRAFAKLPHEIVWPKKAWPGFWLSKWRRRFPNASVRVLPTARHYIQEDAPDDVAAAITRVLARV
jgi:haloalkane dehalogenase